MAFINVSLSDLQALHQTQIKEINTNIQDVLETCAFIGDRNNQYCKDFENNFSLKIGTNHTIGCANGSDALEIALRALDIGPGDEVIVPAMTWIATATAVMLAGAKPVFVDIDLHDYNLGLSNLANAITPKTRAVIAVHLYGNPANLEALNQFCVDNRVNLIEDCAQAHLAKFNGKYCGTFGIISTFSFFPGKNIGAFGDAGCICTDDKGLATKIRAIGNHGQLNKNNHVYLGRNSRLDGLQAALLNVKLSSLETVTSKRQEIANKYLEGIKNPKLTLPTTSSTQTHVFHQFVIRSSDRDGLSSHLKQNGIQNAVHYPIILPSMVIFKELVNSRDRFEAATLLSQTCLSIPIHPTLSDREISYVIRKLNEF